MTNKENNLNQETIEKMLADNNCTLCINGIQSANESPFEEITIWFNREDKSTKLLTISNFTDENIKKKLID